MQATGPVNQFTVRYVESVNMDLDTYGEIIAGTYVISFCVAYGIGLLADRLHPLRLNIITIALYGVTVLFSALFVTGKYSFGVALLAHGVLSGCYFTASASLGQRLLPKENFAQFASASGLVAASLSIVLPALLGTVLDWSGHVYRLTFWAGTLLSVISLGCYAVFYRLWSAHGGMPPAHPPGTAVGDQDGRF